MTLSGPVMGLDVSLCATGVVVFDDNDIYKFYGETVGYELPKKADVEEKINRLIYISDRVIQICKEFRVVYVGVEGLPYKAVGRLLDLAEIRAVVMRDIYQQLGIVPVVIQASSARKFLFGRGDVKKKEVKWLLEKVGIKFSDEHQMDAWIIGNKLRQIVCLRAVGNILQGDFWEKK